MGLVRDILTFPMVFLVFNYCIGLVIHEELHLKKYKKFEWTCRRCWWKKICKL